MDSVTAEQHMEDLGTTEQLREDSGAMEQRTEDLGTTEQCREDLGTMTEQKSRILKLLEDDGVSTVALVGDTGMGKTWMAREISECAVRKGSCYESLWLSVTEKYDINLLYKSIAHQLSLSFITEEWEEEEGDIDSNRDVKDKKIEEVGLESMKPKIKAKLEEKRSALHEEKKYLLLVLDVEGVRDEHCLSSSAQLAHISNSSLVNSQLNRINRLESNSVDKVGSYDQVSRGSTYQAGLALCASIDKSDQRCTVDDIKLSKGQVGYKVD